MDIKGKIGEQELLLGLVEECGELIKAVVKYHRAQSQANPTPVSSEEAQRNIIEEIADVQCYLQQLLEIDDWMRVADMIELKMERWKLRLCGGGNDSGLQSDNA